MKALAKAIRADAYGKVLLHRDDAKALHFDLQLCRGYIERRAKLGDSEAADILSALEPPEALDFAQMVADANARLAALSPEAQAAHWAAQRESFARGMGPCEHGVRDFEDCPDCKAKARAAKR